MLVKLNTRSYVDDFGLLVQGSNSNPVIYMYESGPIDVDKKMEPQQVILVKASWVDRDARVSCEVADTDEKKIIGLQNHTALKKNQGLFFPYAGPTDVAFHQGSVSFPLDIMFLREGSILKIERDTKVGGADKWSCRDCDCVIEVSAGFCEEHGVDLEDRVTLFAYSEQDMREYEADRAAIALEAASDFNECVASLASAIVGGEID